MVRRVGNPRTLCMVKKADTLAVGTFMNTHQVANFRAPPTDSKPAQLDSQRQTLERRAKTAEALRDTSRKQCAESLDIRDRVSGCRCFFVSRYCTIRNSNVTVVFLFSITTHRELPCSITL